MIQIKGIYTNHSSLFQLFLLLALVFAGAILSSLVSYIIIYIMHGFVVDINLNTYPNTMRICQSISAICTFLVPSIIMAWTCSSNPTIFLSLKQIKSVKIWILCICSIIAISPSITFLSFLNKSVVFPDFLEPVESWMQEREFLAETYTKTLLSGNTIDTLISNLIVIAAVAGLTEEFLFRGTLQRVIGKFTTNYHYIIWIAAFLFSAFHLQFYGFIPRMILGAYFGYLLYWGKSIWLPTVAHFTNNAISVIGYYTDFRNCAYISGDIQQGDVLYFSVTALISTILFLLIANKIKRIL